MLINNDTNSQVYYLLNFCPEMQIQKLVQMPLNPPCLSFNSDTLYKYKYQNINSRTLSLGNLTFGTLVFATYFNLWVPVCYYVNFTSNGSSHEHRQIRIFYHCMVTLIYALLVVFNLQQSLHCLSYLHFNPIKVLV